jgi:hypothetical protein
MLTTCVKGHIVVAVVAKVQLFQVGVMVYKTFPSTGVVEATKDVVPDAAIAYALTGVAISHIDVIAVKDVMFALYFHDTVLIDYAGIIKDLTEVEDKGASYELHHPHLVLGVHKEVGP